MSEVHQVDPLPPGAPTPSPAMNNTQVSAVDDNDAILKGVTIEHVHEECKRLYTEKEKTEAWSDVAKKVETYSDKMIQRWITEIDTYLLLAGLFSAIFTAFNVPAYALLNPAPPDPSISLLQQISSKLDSFSINHPFVNSTLPSSTNSPNAGTASPIPRWAVWLNGLWFSGLIFSLASTSIGLMSKQWLNEYTSGISETSRHAARVRQYRLENLKAWHVEEVVNTIPVLLQLSLVCFLSGLLLFLWNLHNVVAAIASILVGILAIFTIAVTLLPLWKPTCAYLSPQTRALYYIWQPKQFIYRVCATLLAILCCRTIGESWRTRLDSYFEKWKESKTTWQGQERSRIDKHKRDLDVSILGEAYRITLHPHTLSTITVCLMGFDANDAIGCFHLLHKYANQHFGTQATDVHSGIWGQQQMLWLYVILCKFLPPKASAKTDDLPETPLRLTAEEDKSLRTYFQSGSWPSSMRTADGEWAASTLDALTDHLEGKLEGTEASTEASIVSQLRAEKTRLMDDATSDDREEPLMSVVRRVISGAYRQVRREQKRLTNASSNEAGLTADISYLKSVWHQFLEYSSRTLTWHNDRETFRAYTPDVLTDLTHALLELFTEGERRPTIKATHLDDVMRKLCELDDTRLEECIPDALVPNILDLAETIVTSADYYDNRLVDGIQRSASVLTVNITRVKSKPAATWAYNRVRLHQKPEVSSRSDEARAAYTGYLRSVDHFLGWANHALTSSPLSADDLETAVRTYMRRVLTELTDTLLELFAKGRVRTTIESMYLNDVMRKLRDLDDTRVEEYIPNERVAMFLDLAEKLITAKDYDEIRCVEEIQESAWVLTANIARVKCKPATAWAYDQVRVRKEDFDIHLSSDDSESDARAAHTRYLHSVDYFLECVNHDTISSGLSADGKTVREYAWDVLTKLTDTLLELFAKDRVRTIIESTYLDDIMQKLRALDDTCAEEYIPDELVPKLLDLAETLATTTDYHDNRWVKEIQDSARKLKADVARLKINLAAPWAYHRVRLQQKPEMSPDEARAAHTSYLQSVDNFLACANLDAISSGPSGDGNTVRECAWEVLTKLTDTLLELFAKDRVRTTIESTYLDGVMQRLCNLDDTSLRELIPDKLVLRVLELAGTLTTAADYYDDLRVEDIQDSARAFEANIARVRCNLAAPWAYHRVRLQQKPGASIDEARAAHTSYLQSVDNFLEWADHASTSSTLELSSSDPTLITVRAYMQDVLTELTRTLLELVLKDQVRTTIETRYLFVVMQKLRDLDDTRLGECIPDGLVQEILDLAEKLATANHYADDSYVDDIQSAALRLDENINRVKYNKPAVTWAYHRVHLRQKPGGASPDEARAAHRRYLQNVDYFLECINRASTSLSAPANDLDIVRAYTQNILTQLTHTLLELVPKDQARTTIESTYLDDVLGKLRNLDDARLGECVPDELVPKILDLVEKLATVDHYADDVYVDEIQYSALRLDENINRVKCNKSAMSWAYDQVRLRQEHLVQEEHIVQASPDEANTAPMRRYLQRVDYFLERVDHVSTPAGFSANDVETVEVRAHTREVLTQLTQTLLELVPKDQARTTIESTYLDDVMRKLRNLDDIPLGECVPDELVPKILDLVEKLATTNHYADDVYVDEIQSSALRLDENINRVKCNKPAATWAYDQVRLRQEHLAQASPDEANTAPMRRYLQRVDYFLERVNQAWTSSGPPANELETEVRAHTREVLTQLTHTLLELVLKDQARTTIESTYLDDVMRKLRNLDDIRLGECIPDVLVPKILDLAEKLATTNHYADDVYVDEIQSSARDFQDNIDRVKSGKPVATWAYDKVRLRHTHLIQAPSDDARVAHGSYLRSVDYFLGCTDRDLTSSLRLANELETVRTQTQDVLTQLSHTLLELFANDRVHTTIESRYLYGIMQKLSSLDDTRVGECIPDQLVPRILSLVGKLATASDYCETLWVEEIQHYARAFEKTITRVKCNLGARTSPETLITRLPETEPAVSARAITQTSDSEAGQVDARLDDTRDPGGDSQNENVAVSGDALL